MNTKLKVARCDGNGQDICRCCIRSKLTDTDTKISINPYAVDNWCFNFLDIHTDDEVNNGSKTAYNAI